MGVPKFFRWCAERYPNITRNLGNFAPPVDNLYLDVNGIIHNCTHPNDIDVLKKAPSEKEMIHGIFSYLERLFSAVQPRKHFVVAVDGVAPRAKMNQQRQRRYRAGYEMMVAREDAISLGEEVPEESSVFDSNCITPGTPFMVLVSEKIQYFLSMKVSTDPSWKNCKIVYSGHDCPGEGEHKIVEFIRRRKMEPGYSPNETHCMYGLDADLIMLALTTHEPHFILLREEVKFGKNDNKSAKNGGRGYRAEVWKDDPRLMTSQTFVLLDIDLLRQYLSLELNELCKVADVPANHDLEHFYDDFVFTCFFIGNDFLPALPTASINDDVILVLLKLYVKEVRSKNAYLTNNGKIQWQHVEEWMNAFGKSEMDIIRKRQHDEEQHQKYLSRQDASHEVQSSLTKTFETINEYKEHYYTTKHQFSSGYQPTGNDLRVLRQHYVEGLTWVMDYYYQGPQSWKWYFPHYYAPMASDLIGLVSLGQQVFFGPSEPFLPHQQLLAVLPPMSYRCLPSAYWPLLQSKNSPLSSAFPEHIEIDREGARAPWEGIVIIPFLDEDCLLRAYDSVQCNLSEKEQQSNKLGPPLEFFFDMNYRVSVIDDMFPSLIDIPVRKRTYTLPELRTFIPQLCPGYVQSRVVEGFGSLQSPHSLEVSFGRDAVKVFDMPSRRESLYIKVECKESMRTTEDAENLIGKEVLVGYPYWCRAKLQMLESATAKVFRHSHTNKIVTLSLEPSHKSGFLTNSKKHAALLLQRQGIVLEDIPILAYVCLFSGMEEDNNGVLRRHYSASAVEYPIQLISFFSDMELLDDPRFVERRRLFDDSHPPQESCVVIREGPSKNDPRQVNHFGAAGRILSSEESTFPSTAGGAYSGKKRILYNIRVKIPKQIEVPQSILDSNRASNWKSAYEVAARLGLNSTTITTLCGSCPTTPAYGSRELGLPIKFDLQSLSRVGYAKLVHKLSNLSNVTEYSRIAKEAPPEGHYLSPKSGVVGVECRRRDGIWLLSHKAVKLVCEYIEAFPPVIKALQLSNGDFRQLDPMQFLCDEWADRTVDDVIDEIEAFVKNSGLLEAPVMPSWEDIVPLPELEALEAQLVKEEERHHGGNDAKPVSPSLPSSASTTVSKVVGSSLIKRVPSENLFFPAVYSEGGQIITFPVKSLIKRSVIYRLGSRVVNCCVTGCVPFGATGTIVRFFYARDAEVVYDVPFIGGSRLGGRLHTDRGAVQRLQYLLPFQMDQKPSNTNLCDVVFEEYFQRNPSKNKELVSANRSATTPTTKQSVFVDPAQGISLAGASAEPSSTPVATVRPLPSSAIHGAPFYGSASHGGSVASTPDSSLFASSSPSYGGSLPFSSSSRPGAAVSFADLVANVSATNDPSQAKGTSYTGSRQLMDLFTPTDRSSASPPNTGKNEAAAPPSKDPLINAFPSLMEIHGNSKEVKRTPGPSHAKTPITHSTANTLTPKQNTGFSVPRGDIPPSLPYPSSEPIKSAYTTASSYMDSFSTEEKNASRLSPPTSQPSFTPGPLTASECSDFIAMCREAMQERTLKVLSEK